MGFLFFFLSKVFQNKMKRWISWMVWWGVHRRNWGAGSLANSLSTCSLQLFVYGNFLMFCYLCIGEKAVEKMMWSLVEETGPCMVLTVGFLHDHEQVTSACCFWDVLMWESLIATFYPDFCSFEDETEHPKERGAVDVISYIRCWNTRLIPLAGLTAAWHLAWQQR